MSRIRVTYDGDTCCLECFARRSNAKHGIAFHLIAAGDTSEQLRAAVAKHEALHGCGVQPVAPGLDEAAQAEIARGAGVLAAGADATATPVARALAMRAHEDQRVVALLTREADEQSEDGFPMAAAFAAHLALRVYQTSVAAARWAVSGSRAGAAPGVVAPDAAGCAPVRTRARCRGRRAGQYRSGLAVPQRQEYSGLSGRACAWMATGAAPATPATAETGRCGRHQVERVRRARCPPWQSRSSVPRRTQSTRSRGR